MTKKHHVRIGKDPERLNRGFWDEDADDYQAEHESQLDVDTMGWGVWDLPETELGVLGDVNGLDVLEYGCGAAQWAIKLARVGRDRDRARPVTRPAPPRGGEDRGGRRRRPARLRQCDRGPAAPTGRSTSCSAITAR